MLTTSLRTIGFALAAGTALVPLSLGCTGFVPDRGPGSDNWLSYGDIAVDPRTETSYVLRVGSGTEPARAQRLVAVSADEHTVRTVTDLTGLSDVRVLFPSSGVLVMAHGQTSELLSVFDRDTLAPVTSRTQPTFYWGTRTSASGRFVAVADNAAPHAPIHVLDATTLEVEVVPHDGAWVEAMWLRAREELLAIVYYGDTNNPHTRLLAWNADALVLNGFATDSSGLWPSPTLDVTVDHTSYDLFFSYTWIGVSPDDRYAVFPVIQSTTVGGDLDRHRLIVLNLNDYSQRVIDDAYGPVGFTADGASIVSYRYDTPLHRDPASGEWIGMSGAHLLVADTETLALETLDLPVDGGPQFFVTREGNWVLATVYATRMDMGGTTTDVTTSMLYDLTTGTSHVLGRPVTLGQHVSRVGQGELWVVDQAGLSRITLMSGALDAIPLSFVPAHLNILPRHDRLVMDDTANDEALHFFDPQAGAVTSSVVLPSPSGH